MAAIKSTKASASSRKNLPPTTETPNQQIPPTPSPTTLLSPEQRSEIERELLLRISAATQEDPPTTLGEDFRHMTNLFAYGSSQVNTDLTMAAALEFDGDLFEEDPTFYHLMQSPMYLKLVKTFIAAAEDGDSIAVLMLVWRAYNAGRSSPERLIPDTEEVRAERRRDEEWVRAKRQQMERERKASQ
jgi:hypothetical protein